MVANDLPGTSVSEVVVGSSELNVVVLLSEMVILVVSEVVAELSEDVLVGSFISVGWVWINVSVGTPPTDVGSG